MPHDMDSRQQAQAQAQQIMMQHQAAQQYGYSTQPTQHWQQPNQQQMAYQMQYVSPGMEYVEKNTSGGYGYAAAAAVDPNDYYAAQQRQQQQQQYMYSQVYAQQQYPSAAQGYGQMAGDRDSRGGMVTGGSSSAANFNPGAPPPNFARPPPAVKRAEQSGDTNNIHGSPLSVFENAQSSAAYTASWVSSTSSIPPELKDSPEDMQITAANYQQQQQQLQQLQSSHGVQNTGHHGQARGTMPGGEWVQPGGGANEYGATWGERRDDEMFGGHNNAVFDHTQFSRMNLDDTHHTGYATTGMGEWNSPEKNHPQQGIAWQTVSAGAGATATSAQPLLLMGQTMMGQGGQNGAKMGKENGGYGNGREGEQRMGGQQRRDQRDNLQSGPLTWEERLKKAQGAKERAENAGNRGVVVEQREERRENTGGFNSVPPRRGRGNGGGMRGGRGERLGGNGEETRQKGMGGHDGWKGGPPEADNHMNNPYSMQQQQIMGNWRGGPMRGGMGGMPQRGMAMMAPQMRGGRGGGGYMMMRGGPMGGFTPMMPPRPPTIIHSAPGVAQDEKFRSTWLDANMYIPPMMGFPTMPMGGPPMMMRGGLGRGRGMGGRGFVRGGRGGYRGGQRQSPHENSPHESGEQIDEKASTPVDEEKENEVTSTQEATVEESAETHKD